MVCRKIKTLRTILNLLFLCRENKNRKYSTNNRITLIIKVPPMYQTFSLLLQVLLRLSYTPKLKNTAANRYKKAPNNVDKTTFQKFNFTCAALFKYNLSISLVVAAIKT